MSLAAFVLLGCSDKGKPPPPPPPRSDAGVNNIIYQSGDPEAIRTPRELLAATSSLEWSVGLSQPIGLLSYRPVDSHPAYCKEGRLVLEELRTRIEADTTAKTRCTPRIVANREELEVQCTLNINGECPYLYRATIWSENDRAVFGRYRVLATAWLQETMCGDSTIKDQVASADPNIAINITVGTKLRAVLDPCRQGTPP